MPKPNTRIANVSDVEESAITLQSLDAKLNSILQISSTTADDIKKLKTDQADMCQSIELCHNVIADLNKTLNNQSVQINDLEACVISVVDENVKLRSEVRRLDSRVNELSQYSHRNSLIVSGLPEVDGEKMDYLLSKVATAIKFPEFTMEMVDAAHRLGAPGGERNSVRPIIVKFVRRYDKDLFLHKRRLKRALKASDIGFASESVIYVNESLTAENRKLLKATRDAARRLSYSYVWTVNAKIYVRKSEGRPAKLISSFDALNQL